MNKLDFKNNQSPSYRTVVDLEIENVRDINDDVILKIGQTVEHKKFGVGQSKSETKTDEKSGNKSDSKTETLTTTLTAETKE